MLTPQMHVPRRPQRETSRLPTASFDTLVQSIHTRLFLRGPSTGSARSATIVALGLLFLMTWVWVDVRHRVEEMLG